MNPVAIIHGIPIHYKHLLFSELARRGLEFEVLFLASGSKERLEFPDLAAAIYKSRIGFNGPYEKLPRWRTIRYVWRCLNEIQPPVVIIPGWSALGAWTAKLWCICHSRPHILWAESNYVDHPRVFWKEMIKRAFLRGFCAAHVYGTSNAEYLVRLGFESSRIWSKRAVADTALFRPAEQSRPHDNSRKVVLFVGRLAPEKNLVLVLQALHQLPVEVRRKILLRVVGYGSLEGPLRVKAESLGLDDVVDFAGPRKHNQLAEVYHSSDILLLPSTSEAWGLTVNEGMLSGLPAIVSERCGCTRDLVSPRTGWSFNPCDAAGLARIMETVVATPPDKLREMGKTAAALAAEYSPGNCADIVLDCLSKAVVNASGTSLGIHRKIHPYG